MVAALLVSGAFAMATLDVSPPTSFAVTASRSTEGSFSLALTALGFSSPFANRTLAHLPERVAAKFTGRTKLCLSIQ